MDQHTHSFNKKPKGPTRRAMALGLAAAPTGLALPACASPRLSAPERAEAAANAFLEAMNEIAENVGVADWVFAFGAIGHQGAFYRPREHTNLANLALKDGRLSIRWLDAAVEG